jgi:hypothetical protein
MTSTSLVASTSSTTLTQELGPQAGPIPSKRGEIGFIDGVHVQVQEPSQMVYQLPLPARHPADSRAPTPFQDPPNETSPLSVTFQTISDGNSMTIAGEPPFPVHKQPPNFMGIHFTTLVLLGTQVLLFAGTLIGWVFAALAFSGSGTPKVHPPGVVNNQNIPPPDPGTSHIFLHVAFAVVSLVQAVLIERRIFRARAERYAFKHPGDMFPTSPQDGQSGPDASMPVAPWNRPPLPTYAAALASSGVGTGDVEDVEIARPPPPAYGKTRGSTLVLASYLRDSLRVQARVYERDRRASGTSVRSDRPISFVSRDEEWEVRRDADRARRIEEGLENDTL